MKTKVSIVIVLIVLIAGGYWWYVRPAPAENTVRIGVITSLTGPAASLGEFMHEGVRMAYEGGMKEKGIELVTEEDGCNGKGGVAAYQKLRAAGVRYIVGPLCGASRIPVLAAAENDEAILVTTGLALVTAPATRAHTFNVLPSVTAVTEAIFDYAAGTGGYRKISLLYPADDYGQENEIAARGRAVSSGVFLPSVEKYARGATDLRTQVLKLKTDGSDAVLVAAYGPDYAVFLKQAKELGLTKPIFAVSNVQTPEAAKMDAETGQKIYYSYPVSSGFPTVKAFGDAYRARHGGADGFVPMYVGSGYDALKILAAAVAECGDDFKCVDMRLKGLRGYAGANGPIDFDGRGNNGAAGGIEIRVLEKGVFSRM